MKLIAKIELKPNSEQHQLLEDTLETANAACNYISQIAWNNQTFGQFKIHKLVYYEVRATFGLPSQLAIRCIAKVTDAYKKDKKTKRTFNQFGAIPYDDNNLRYWVDDQSVSLSTIGKRQKLPFVCGARQTALLATCNGESDLCYLDGRFYLLAVCEVDEPKPEDVEHVMGVDLGIVNIATESDGTEHRGTKVNTVRKRRQRQRKRLQKKGAKSAKRVLKKIRRKEKRFAKDVNHTISKRIAQQAKHTKSAIALEDLKGIRERVRVRKSQRATLHSWSFRDLKEKIVYKAALAGVKVVMTDPRNTSKTCSECGHCSRSNRKNQADFQCINCGYAANADHNAARNISVLGWAGLSSGHTDRAPLQIPVSLVSVVG